MNYYKGESVWNLEGVTWNLATSMDSPHHVVDERVVFAIWTSPTFMQNARGQFENGRPSYLHVYYFYESSPREGTVSETSPEFLYTWTSS